MRTFNKTLIALGVVGALSGTAASVLAVNDKTADKPFEGVVVEDVVVIEQLPPEVQSGSIRMNDGNERARAAQARVSASDAVQIAMKALPGKVVESRLDEENGYLIWEVEVVNAQGQEAQLKIDAGDGRLLAAEAGEDGERHDGDRKDDEREDHAQSKHSSWKFWEDNDRDERGGDRE